MKFRVGLPTLFFILLCVSCSKKTEIIYTEADQVLENFSAFESDLGKRIWDLNARKAYVHESENTVLLKNYKVKFYEKDWGSSHSSGKKEEDVVNSILTAKEGRIDILKNDFYTEGKTTVTTSDGEILECNDLVYISAKKKIFTDSQFTLFRKDSIIKGRGLEATPDLSVVVVKHNKVVVYKERNVEGGK